MTFAELQPGPTEVGNSVIIAAAIGGQLLSMVFNGCIVFLMARRTPPLGEQMHKEFVPGSDFKDFREETSESVRRIHARIDEVKTEVGKGFQDMERALGRIEGRQKGDGD